MEFRITVVMTLYSKRNKDVKNILVDCVGEGDGGMIGGDSTETCTLPYAK